MQADTPALEPESWLTRLKSTFLNLNWKYVALGAGLTFFLAPAPFLKLFKPLIKRIYRSYTSLKNDENKKIIFTTSQNLIDEILVKLSIKRSSVLILNYQNVCRSQNKEICEIWSKIIETELNNTFERWIVVVANPLVIQSTEIRLYHMEEKERFKIELIGERQFHTINYEASAFRLTYETVDM